MSTRQLNNRAETPSIFMVDLTLHNIVVERLKKLISDKELDICSQYLITKDSRSSSQQGPILVFFILHGRLHYL